LINRGVIACRIIRTLRRLGVSPIAVFSDADRHSLHVTQADEAVRLGPPPAAESYLNQHAILAAANSTGAEAIHPGYGFLSENASFAEACENAGIVFLGPTPAQMHALGLKHTAREIALRVGAPLLPGTGLLNGESHALVEAERCGYPVILEEHCRRRWHRNASLSRRHRTRAHHAGVARTRHELRPCRRLPGALC
jgi:urea carboxylase